MINHLYFVRHGQSTANAAHVYAGQRVDIQLTELGREQATEAGQAIKPWAIDHIIASDLDRAQETAHLIAARIGLPESAITTDLHLREIRMGALTGQPENGFVEYLSYVAKGDDHDIESPQDVQTRLELFLSSIQDTQSGNVLLVSHAGIGRMLQSILVGTPLAVLAERSLANAQPFELPLKKLMENQI